MLKNIRMLSAISFLEGLAAFIWLASLPAEGSFFSPVRMGFLAGILAISAGWLLLYTQKDFALRAMKGITTWSGRFIVAGLSICLALLILSIAAQKDVWSPYMEEAVYVRLIPIWVWSSILLIQVGLFLITPEVEYEKLFTSVPSLWKPTIILLVFFILIWGFVSVTKIGITGDVVGLSWGPPGTPLTFGQLSFVFAISVSLAVFYILFSRKFIWPQWLIDSIIFIGLWLLASFLWWQQPMIQSHFAPVPMEPNFEYYPNSDALIFDKASYQLLHGTGFDTQLVRRPVYVGMLALFHKIAGPSYERTIFLQILTLAFIPALVYLLTAKLSNRLAGLLAGGLIMLREANAIHLSGEIITSHAKLMMSDLVAMFGVVIILYVSIILFSKRRHTPWTLAILGAFIGITVLVRAQTLIILAPILLCIILMKRPIKLGLYESVIILSGVALALLPWVWRNWNLTGTFLLDDRGEERLLARNYSSNPISLPPKLPNETEQEFSARLRQEVFAYATTHPNEVLFFISNHFFHNMANSVVYIAPIYSNDSAETLLNRVPFWGIWDGELPHPSGIFLFTNLALLAFGIVVAQQQARLAGILPLVIFIIYSGGNAIVRTSGWRFSLPVDWIILMYYCIGLAYFPSKIGFFLQKSPSIPVPHSKWKHPAQYIFSGPVLFSLLFLVGASVPLAEQLIPLRNFKNSTLEARQMLNSTETLSSQNLETFLQQENAIFLSGIALYPRYYKPNSKVYLAGTPTDYKYLHFWIINNGDFQIVFPLQDPPNNIPHTSMVSILGCKTDEYISAWAIIIHSQPKQILTRVPGSSLECPLTEPN